MSKPLVSLCMPTNGIIDWVFPVLESIYNQQVNNEQFEVVITDNGNNAEFKKYIKEYLPTHTNIVYAETQALPFVNEIESYKRASGELIKFVNHRTKLVEGTLQKMIDYVESNREIKPVTYFSNGVLKMSNDKHEYTSFNEFVRNLSYWSSWSSGMTIWKSDFDDLPEDVSTFNELFPHTNVLFDVRDRGKYVIDNSIIFDEMSQGKKPKGNYDLYYAFGVDYPRIIENLLKDGSITDKTCSYVLDKNLEFIARLYWQYNIKKEYCSYDLSGFDEMIGKYYSKSDLNIKVMKYILTTVVNKMIGR